MLVPTRSGQQEAVLRVLCVRPGLADGEASGAVEKLRSVVDVVVRDAVRREDRRQSGARFGPIQATFEGSSSELTRKALMRISLRRIGVALGALVEAVLIIWLLGGFLPAGLPAVVLAVVLGGLIYQDIMRRKRWTAPAAPNRGGAASKGDQEAPDRGVAPR
jgi:hypothetical protein